MDSFVNRERALESKFQHDQLLAFKVLARRNRLFGLWVAELMGLEEVEAETYARSLVSGKYCLPDGLTLIEKTSLDLEEAKLEISPHTIRKQLDYCHQDATKQIYAE